jgi:3'(2'), 5'-bisphosphate nucleotidase
LFQQGQKQDLAMNKPTPAAPAMTIEVAAALIEPLTDLVVQAGTAVLAVDRGSMRVEGKCDGSPVTEADLAADGILGEGLARLAPEIPTLSEERAQSAKPPFRGSFFLIDPLDGTKEFVAGRGEFTINLALVTNGMPLLGIIGAPALGWLWRGLVGRGAERLRLSEAGRGAAEPIHTRALPRKGEPWVAAVSRSHGDPRTEAFIASRPGAVREPLGSAVKFGRVAEGTVDIYPRLAPTSEWDIAAGHAIVTAAGGKVTDADGRPVRFGEQQEGFIVPAFIAWGDPSADG